MPPEQETEFVFRRLTDALQIAGRDVNPYYVWPAVLIPVFILAVVYVVWMYVRDGRAVGWAWATFLGSLRVAVYALLAWVFLLPAWQTWERAEHHSRVVLLFDVSGSMTSTKDDLPTEAMPVEKLLTRQDKVVRFLTDRQIGFLRRLQEKNPVAAYRFGGVPDDKFQVFENGREWSADEWGAWLKPDPKEEPPADLGEEERAKFQRKIDLYVLLTNHTNLGESLLAVLNREANNMLQGIVVVSDGRSTRSSDATFNEVRTRARGAHVPIFTVAVGEQRQPVNIRITDLQAPDQARPEDKFPVRVEIDGEGLAGKDVDVTLEATKPNGEKAELKPVTRPGEVVVFKPGEPPHAQAEFEIDKPEEGDWKLVARIPKDKRETFAGKEHATDPVTVHVVKKPLRVLLFAGAPTRDYQFLRTLLVREMDRKRVEVSIYLQLSRPEVVQDVPEDRMLSRFPDILRAEDSPDATGQDRYYNLAQYDLIVAFDPDWTQLSRDQMKLLERWVGTNAGGLVIVAGPVNMYQLALGKNFENVRPILELLPVIPDDSRLQGLSGERSTADPWRLNFPGAAPDMEFLKVDEEDKDQLAGWELFFNGRRRGEGPVEGPPKRGFYDYYPVRSVKPSATVVATFTDPRARTPDGKEQPFLVGMPYGNGKVFYIASGEIWRLRQFRELYHERFWTKLARYAGSGNLTRSNRRGVFSMGKVFSSGQYAAIRIQLLGPDLRALPRTEHVRAEVVPPPGIKGPIRVDLQPEPGRQGDDWNGYFIGRLFVTAPGNYDVRVPVPGTPELVTWKFSVKEANPELDNTTPDFARLRDLAGEAADVLARVPDPVKAKVRPELERTNRAAQQTAAEADVLKLYFDLKAASLIPDCMVAVTKTQRSRGPVKDIWDDGFVVREGDPPAKLSYALLLAVGLLSVEWLTRKLIRLA